MAKKPKIDLSSLSRKNLQVTKVTSKTPDLPVGYELSGTKDIDLYLFDKATDIINITRKSRLELGETFQEVHDRLSGDNQYNGIYTKWLEFYGFNKMTALRHRNRYSLYSTMKSEKAKELVSKITDDWVNKLMKHANKEYILETLENTPTRENLAVLLSNTITEKNISLEFDIESEFKEFSKRSKEINLNALSENEKEELHKIITKFNKLFRRD
ncbi:hypothetical protein [uncultured Ilyobacter sp.]|uniref:hypothetical protein n=1 Tax=uncultured Ilyobacter sp. TaxID=544433 RepID=UPI0029C05334|nr:hypothetical protein [uncultured Ilyobacter sp.]